MGVTRHAPGADPPPPLLSTHQTHLRGLRVGEKAQFQSLVFFSLSQGGKGIEWSTDTAHDMTAPILLYFDNSHTHQSLWPSCLKCWLGSLVYVRARGPPPPPSSRLSHGTLPQADSANYMSIGVVNE